MTRLEESMSTYSERVVMYLTGRRYIRREMARRLQLGLEVGW